MAQDVMYKYGDVTMGPFSFAAAVTNGQVVDAGTAGYKVAGVMHTDLAANVAGETSLGGGVYEVTAGEAVAIGDALWFNNSTKKLMKTFNATYFAFGRCLQVGAADGAKVLAQHNPAYAYAVRAMSEPV